MSLEATLSGQKTQGDRVAAAAGQHPELVALRQFQGNRAECTDIDSCRIRAALQTPQWRGIRRSEHRHGLPDGLAPEGQLTDEHRGRDEARGERERPPAPEG